MKWEKPEIVIEKFELEDILTVSSMTPVEAEEYVDIKGAKKSFIGSWVIGY